MSAHRAVQAIRQIARHEVQQHPGAALGVVQSVFGSDDDRPLTCSVALRDSGLVLPKVPIAVGLMGEAALPAVDDLVVVLFAGGDLHAPIVIGRLYSERVAPPQHAPGETALTLPGGETDPQKALDLRIVTPGDGTRALRLTLDGRVKIELTVDDQGLVLRTQDASLTLSQTGASDANAELKVGASKITMAQGGDVTIEAAGKLTLKGASIAVSGDTNIKVDGTTVDIN